MNQPSVPSGAKAESNRQRPGGFPCRSLGPLYPTCDWFASRSYPRRGKKSERHGTTSVSNSSRTPLSRDSKHDHPRDVPPTKGISPERRGVTSPLTKGPAEERSGFSLGTWPPSKNHEGRKTSDYRSILDCRKRSKATARMMTTPMMISCI